VTQSPVASGLRLAWDIARRYEADGYEVTVEPAPEQLPEPLASYHPDLLVRKGGETVLIEIKSRAELQKKELEELAAAVRQLPGWRLELVLARPDAPVAVPEDSVPWDQDDVRAALQQAADLLRSHYNAAALLLAWSAVEAALRLVAERERIPLERDDAAYILKRLATSGAIAGEQYHELRAAMELRNAMAHGLKPSRMDESQTRRLIEVGEDLLRTA
jgi:hypothetical protein